uniref:Uncharacterized protein n=1 Tax=Triticum urartu TaxID=4572 RepID=A0A8R7TSV8_TRIUA
MAPCDSFSRKPTTRWPDQENSCMRLLRQQQPPPPPPLRRPDLSRPGASYRRFLKNVRLVAYGLSLVWAFTL